MQYECLIVTTDNEERYKELRTWIKDNFPYKYLYTLLMPPFKPYTIVMVPDNSRIESMKYRNLCVLRKELFDSAMRLGFAGGLINYGEQCTTRYLQGDSRIPQSLGPSNGS